MCAIAGLYHGAETLKGIEEVSAVISKMAHRGPDGKSFKALGRITFGHARLAITDLSARANEPYATEDGRYTIVFNGAIYNYRELRTDMEKSGIRFYTTSDTEVFLKLFSLHGVRSFDMLRGMFAAGIWDATDQRLVLVRDRFGEKPLYYRQCDGGFYFASECDALALACKEPAINLTALNHLMAIGYILNPESIYVGIYSVPPASYIEITEAGRNSQTVRYWDYGAFFEHKFRGSRGEAVEQFKSLMRKSVSQCIDCEVPYGFFLSGGLDSATLIALAAREKNVGARAYTIHFESERYSEFQNAVYTARYFNCIHHTFLFGDKDISDSAMQIINLLSSPITDNSFLPMYRLASEAKNKCKVILTGDGADELMAGYATYKADKLYSSLHTIPSFIKKILADHTILPDSDGALSSGFMQKQFFAGLQSDYKRAHYSWRQLHTEEQRVKIMGEECRELIYDTDPFRKFEKIYSDISHLDKYDQFLVVDALTWLTDNILIKSDRALMANGIEGRSPFLDNELAGFVASLPFEWKLNGFTGKHLLREAMREYLPKEILNRAKKGFNNPPFLKNRGVNQFVDYNEWFIRSYRKGILNNHYDLTTNV